MVGRCRAIACLADPRPGRGRVRLPIGRDVSQYSKSAFEKIQRLGPGSARAQQLLGEQYSISGDLSNALSAFRQAAAADPRLAGTHLAMAVLLLRQDKREQALSEIDKELEIAPESVIAKQVRQAITGAAP